MGESNDTLGKIGWVDLTVDDAERLRDFYSTVVGWQPSTVDMGDYSDFNMNGADGQASAGICHKRESNADLPPCWMIYIFVADLDASVARCRELGGEVLSGPRGSHGRFAVIRDPAGAVCALFEQTA